MITNDQPDCFPGNVRVAVSSRQDGTMLDRSIGVHADSIVANRTRFCMAAGIDYDDTVYQRIIYDASRSYALIAEVDAGSTTKFTQEVVADALYTTTPGIAMMLPVADCIPAVLYDPTRQALAIAHLGRHSTYAKLAPRIVKHFIANGSNPVDLIVWMGPHAQKQSYRMEWFDRTDDPDWQGFFSQGQDGYYLDMAGFNRGLMIHEGVPAYRIHTSLIDTVTDENYFSHAAGEASGRIALVAQLT